MQTVVPSTFAALLAAAGDDALVMIQNEFHETFEITDVTMHKASNGVFVVTIHTREAEDADEGPNRRRCARVDCSGWTFDANPNCEDCR